MHLSHQTYLQALPILLFAIILLDLLAIAFNSCQSRKSSCSHASSRFHLVQPIDQRLSIDVSIHDMQH